MRTIGVIILFGLGCVLGGNALLSGSVVLTMGTGAAWMASLVVGLWGVGKAQPRRDYESASGASRNSEGGYEKIQRGRLVVPCTADRGLRDEPLTGAYASDNYDWRERDRDAPLYIPQPNTTRVGPDWHMPGVESMPDLPHVHVPQSTPVEVPGYNVTHEFTKIGRGK